jgi:hypothetical protein
MADMGASVEGVRAFSAANRSSRLKTRSPHADASRRGASSVLDENLDGARGAACLRVLGGA